MTKKATASIGLKKAIAVEDDQEARADLLSPASALTSRSTRAMDDYDCVGGVERSFRLIFPNEEEIMFFADTDDEKAKWSVFSPHFACFSLLTVLTGWKCFARLSVTSRPIPSGPSSSGKGKRSSGSRPWMALPSRLRILRILPIYFRGGIPASLEARNDR